MNRKQVVSSNGGPTTQPKRPLTVEMITSNRLYVYQDVPQEVYDGLAAAESAGRYYGQNIKNKFACLIEEPFLEDGPPAA